MKKNISMLRRLFVLLLVLSLVLPTATASAAKTGLNKTSVTIKKGKTVKLKVKGAKKSIKWSSSNKKIATVSDKGVVTGVKGGNCKVKAKVGKKKYTCKVTVINPIIYATKDTIKMNADGKLTFFFNASGRFEWKIADPSIVTGKWSEKWKNTKKGYRSDITLYGHKNGTTTLTLTNDQNKDKHVIKIIVSGFGDTSTSNNQTTTTPTGNAPTIKGVSNTWFLLDNKASFTYDAASGFYSFTVEGLHSFEKLDIYNVKMVGYDAAGNQTFMTIEPAYYVNDITSKFTYNQVPSNTTMIVISDFIS